MQISIRDDLVCPTCGSPEMRDASHVNIRGHKVHQHGRWWSQCLVCAGYYSDTSYDDSKATYDNPPKTFDRQKGWF